MAKAFHEITAFVLKARHLAHQWLPALSPLSWGVLYAPLAVFFALVVSQGYELQRAVFSTVVSNAPDIYTARHANGIADYQSLFDWIAAAFQWPYLLLGGAIAFMTVRASTIRGAMLAAGVWLAIFYTIFDLIFAEEFSLTAMITNAAANFLGGAVTAPLVGAVFVLIGLVRSEFWHSRLLTGIISAAVVVASGFAVVAATYVTLRFLYHPLPAEIDVSFASPAEGFYAPPRPTASAEQRPIPYTFLPRNSVRAGAAIRSYGGAVQANWDRSKQARKFRVNINFMGDCVRPDKSTLASPIFMSSGDARRLKVELDEGPVEIQLLEGDRRTFKFSPGKGTLYWLRPGDKPETVSVTEFSDERDGLRVESSEEFVLLVGVPLYGEKGDHFSAKPRSIRINLDERSIIVNVAPGSKGSENKVLRCHAMSLGSSPLGTINALVEEWMVTAVITIKPESFADVRYAHSEGTLSIADAHGWTTVTNIDYDDWSRSGGGYLGALNYKGSATEMTLDGRAMEIKPHEELTVLGKLQGSFEEGGRAGIRGEAEAVWKNSVRLNRTRWENLPPEWRLALASGILAALGLIGRWFWRRISTILNEDPRTWIARPSPNPRDNEHGG